MSFFSGPSIFLRVISDCRISWRMSCPMRFRSPRYPISARASESTACNVSSCYWHVAVADVELLVEMGQLPARVFQKEFAIDNKGGGEDVREEDADVDENVG